MGGRLLKEREVDQDLWESLVFMAKDDDDVLSLMGDLVAQAESNAQRNAEADAAASEREQRAQQRVISIEHDASMARDELRLARQDRLGTRHRHVESRTYLERLRKSVNTLRMHAKAQREGIADWGMMKGFSDDMLPALQLVAQGGLKRLVSKHKTARHQDAEQISPAEAEAI